jgi:alkane 1-monooxygenase
MNNIKAFKYYSPLIVYVLAFFSFTQTGLLCWLAFAYALVLIPLLELFWKPDEANMEQAEEEMAKQNRSYDYILYLIVIIQFLNLFFFLISMQQTNLHWWDIAARIWTMGLLCGVFGINVGHELGHRTNNLERLLAKASLLTSLYMHFFIEHNKGHHKNVATKEDPSSARKGEMVYVFYFRSIIMSYISAWKIANADTRKKQRPAISLYNEMVQAHLIQLAFVALICWVFGWLITLYFLVAATIGVGLVETVNYIEHYGLSRKEIGEGKYERAMPHHSWNSSHVVGRLMLFELSRHSDHHYLASRKYQTLRHHDNAPQMPTGYPGMLLLSIVPPLWFYVMHKQMKKYKLD